MQFSLRQCCENRARGAGRSKRACNRPDAAGSCGIRGATVGRARVVWVAVELGLNLMWGNSNSSSSIKFDLKCNRDKQRLRQAINYANKQFNGQLKMAAPSGLNGVVRCRDGVDLGRNWIDLGDGHFR
ncbi:hypothetical protein SASPL_133762 [Salvia splendens]|uniref:Uncharacterized protein n=1 Tax=Salvia splendens TaxID=180675 RepID=A0A8X8X3N5_SALSN|nr:hypothetical protein SASPL_133762 [Salvia splendens]